MLWAMSPEHVATAARRRHGLPDWIGLAARLVLGVVWLWAGGAKILHLDESVLAVRGYQILPYELALVVGYALPMVEIVVGLLLILGLLTRWAGLLSSLMMLAFIIGIAAAWARGIAIDCGCFGGGGEIAWEEARRKYPVEIARDLGLFLLGAWLVWRPRTPFSLDERLFGEPSYAAAYADLDDDEDPDDDVTDTHDHRPDPAKEHR
ncbi:hypothetical protein GCM10028815_08940 [Mariniluteicoccus flavus]